jgi:mono/diheme cytochrome c family protein
MKTMSPIKSILVAFAALFGLAAVAAAAEDAAGKLPPASTKQGVTYTADIKPILDASCVKCHSGDKPKAKLKLDSLENSLKGGMDGKVIIPGDSAKSLLVQAAAHVTNDKDLWMPPKKFENKFHPLTPEQIGLVRAWIDQGAK